MRPAKIECKCLRQRTLILALDHAGKVHELIRQVAQGEVLHNDDTHMSVLTLMGKRSREAGLAQANATEMAEHTRGP